MRTNSVPLVEITHRARVKALFGDDPRLFLEVLDESQRGVDELVTVFVPDAAQVGSLSSASAAAAAASATTCLAVRWGQRALGLGSKAVLRALRVGDLEHLLPALPWRGHLELKLPFWASGIVGSMFQTDALTAEAIYELTPDAAQRPAAMSHCVEVSPADEDILGSVFPKRVPGSPAFLLAPGGALASLAAVTHQAQNTARISVYTLEEVRGRGFGRAVLSALSRALLDQGVVPTVSIDLSRIAEVRMVEASGFSLYDVSMRLLLRGRVDLPQP
ncbi:MAG: hypothetical protein H6729_06235 [Deltaproteobacteria bacterium]|nr:hypothetical protein [Deltaproteobacteria bacterium]